MVSLGSKSGLKSYRVGGGRNTPSHFMLRKPVQVLATYDSEIKIISTKLINMT